MVDIQDREGFTDIFGVYKVYQVHLYGVVYMVYGS